VPIIGPLLFEHDPLTYLTVGLVIVAWLVMHRSTLGLSIKAVGEHPVAAETLGLNVIGIRYGAVMVSGALAGLGGAFLSTSATGLFLDNMTAGRGYIALAILILGRRHPFGIVAAALLFGAAEALQLRAQLLPIGVPLQFLIMLPYVLTIVVLAGFAQRSGAPAALGVPFRRHGA
jgi:general nucleoside transport system permease protein